jgi:CheY-like chemotaxis protein
MTAPRKVLLVESDTQCGRALAQLLRRNGHRVRLVRTARAAVAAAEREAYDLAVVDLLLPGGGHDLGRRLSRRVPSLYLSVGARLLPEEIIEMALGFPVLRKVSVPELVGAGTEGKGTSRRSKGRRAHPSQRGRSVRAPSS